MIRETNAANYDTTVTANPQVGSSNGQTFTLDTMPDENVTVTFNNAFDAQSVSVPIAFDGIKTIIDREFLPGDNFSFEVRDANNNVVSNGTLGDTIDEHNKKIDRKANDGKTNYKGYYFSDKANEEMRLYNLTMKVNRLEMLKANIGLEMIKGHAELETFMGEILQGRTEEELKRQAGILGNTIKDNAKLAHTIPNASFHNATFSDRIN